MVDDGPRDLPVPSARTPLVGRDDDIDRVVDLLRRDGVRLVTVTGPGGVGKSVLADEVARRISALDPIGVRKVRVGDASGPLGPDSLAAILAGKSSVELSSDDGAPPGRTRVVLLDGFEVAVAAAPIVSAALDADPDLTVLVTSIVPLSIRGEHLVRLSPLDLPAVDEHRPDRALTSAAVIVLCQRIAALDPTFELTPEITPAAVSLAVRLDGLPLAIELVAARCATTSVHDVLAQMADVSPLSILTSGPVDAEDRHRSLRATIRWSFDLLDEDQQRLLRRLGVFAGSFTRDSMLPLVSWPDDLHDPAARHDPALTTANADAFDALVSTSLVHRQGRSGPGGERRHRLLDSVRDFALEQVALVGETEALRVRHAAWMRTFVREQAELLTSPRQAQARRALMGEASEYLIAIETTRACCTVAETLQFVIDLQPVWIATGTAEVGRRTVRDLLDLLDRPDDDLRVAAGACMAGLSAWTTDAADLHESLAGLDDLFEMALRVDRVDLVLLVIDMGTQLCVISGDLEAATRWSDEGRRRAEDAGEDWWLARLSSWSAVTVNMSGDTAAATRFATRAKELAEAQGDEWQLLRTSLVLNGIPGIQDAPDAHLSSPEQLLVLAERVGDSQAEGFLRIGLAARRLMSGDVETTAEELRTAISNSRRAGHWYTEEICVFLLAMLALSAGRVIEAARLHGGLSGVMTALRRRIPPAQVDAYELMIAHHRDQLGPEAFDAAVAAGRRLGWREVLGESEALLDELSILHEVDLDPDAGAKSVEVATPTPNDTTTPHDTSAVTLVARRGARLTDRELQVLRLIAEGRTNKEIATELSLRPKTVMHHSSHIYRKLGVRSRAEAVTTAWRDGLLQPPEQPSGP